MPATAISNDNVVFIAWSVPAKLEGCIGFTIRRVLPDGRSQPLPAYVGFEGQENPRWKARTTDEWPVQKFAWRDLFAPPGVKLEYEIVALQGPPSAPVPLPGAPVLRTGAVVASPERGGARAWFNRGVISTQATARELTGGKVRPPSTAVLLRRIAQEGDPLRARLSVGLPQALGHLLERARREGGSCRAALYELSDAQLLRSLLDAPRLRIILANAQSDEEYDSTNAAARAALGEAGKAPVDRFMPAGHIGHNKFLVYLDAQGTAQAVLTGSTNWTATGLCTQTNNALLVEDPGIAGLYLEYWDRLEADARAAGAEPGEPAAPNRALQGAELRALDGAPGPELPLQGPGEGGRAQAFFSPNTRQRSKAAATPVDLARVFDLMHDARQAILFLAFQPGTPSILTEIVAIADQRRQRGLPPLLIRGAATDPRAVGDTTTDLFHRGAQRNASVVGVQGIPAPFAYWNKEIYKAGHAVIHDKVVVLDPLDPEGCAVITGSHNLGYRASYMNDENLLVIRGNRALAEAYATHVMDVYEHFRWRWYLREKKAAATPDPDGARTWKPPTWQGLFDDGDAWQDRYFTAGTLACYERRYFGGEQEPALPGAPIGPDPAPAPTPAPARRQGHEPAVADLV